MNIVTVQLNSVWEAKSTNQLRVREMLANSDVEAGSMIVLAEMFETGFSMNVERTSQTQERESEKFLQALAIEYRSTVLGGVVDVACDGKSANLAVAFDPAGKQIVRYQKMRPFSAAGEAEKYVPGTESKTFLWNGIRVAPFICYDLRFPELFRSTVLEMGAELILVIASWPSVRSEHWVRLLQARAIENLAIAIGVNRCGEEPGLSFDGRSCGFDHLGRELFHADATEQVITTKIDIAQLRNWRSQFPALRDAGSVMN